jgi:hypothetical protein
VVVRLALAGSRVDTLRVVFTARAALDRRNPDGTRPLPTDVLPSAGWVVAIMLLVPVLAAAIGALLLRKVIITPLGVVRRTRERRPSVLPGVLLLGGVFAPLVIKPLGLWLFKKLGAEGMGTTIFLIGTTLLIVLAILGVVLGTGWISFTVGRLLQRFGRRPGMLLAGRQLMADPWNGSRAQAALLGSVIIGAGVYAYRAVMATDFRATAEASKRLGDDAGGYAADTAFYFNAISLINIAVDLGIVVAAAAVLIALVEGIVARRRAYAALIAVGVPRRTLGEAIAWQTLAPLVPATLVSLIVGVGLVRAPTGGTADYQGGSCDGAGVCQDAAVSLPVPIPFGELALLGAIAVGVMVLVAAVGWQLLRMSTDLEELRAG